MRVITRREICTELAQRCTFPLLQTHAKNLLDAFARNGLGGQTGAAHWMLDCAIHCADQLKTAVARIVNQRAVITVVLGRLQNQRRRRQVRTDPWIVTSRQVFHFTIEYSLNNDIAREIQRGNTVFNRKNMFVGQADQTLAAHGDCFTTRRRPLKRARHNAGFKIQGSVEIRERALQ